MKTTLIMIGVLAVVSLIALRFGLPRLNNSVARGVVVRDGRDALADCPGTPNCQGSMSNDAAHAVASLPGFGSIAESLEAIEGVLADMPDATVRSRDGAYLHATFKSSLIGFIDDVEFLVDPDGAAIQVRSASRIGHSDLGANATRIERLRDALATQVASDN